MFIADDSTWLLQETEYQQECRTEVSQSCSTVYDTRQECSTKYEQVCSNIPETKCQDIQKPVQVNVKDILFKRLIQKRMCIVSGDCPGGGVHHCAG